MLPSVQDDVSFWICHCLFFSNRRFFSSCGCDTVPFIDVIE